MSVQTRADDCRDAAREHIRKAITNLNEILVDPDCWGADDYCSEYMEVLNDSLIELLKMKRLI